MQHYVVGFLFNGACDRVLLMMERRPAWQAGRWHGVLGKVEAGEDIHTAMHREGAEEMASGRSGCTTSTSNNPKRTSPSSARVASRATTRPGR